MDYLFKYLIAKGHFSVPLQFECSHKPLTIMCCYMHNTNIWCKFQIEQVSKRSYRLLVIDYNTNKYTVYKCSSAYDLKKVLDWYVAASEVKHNGKI